MPRWYWHIRWPGEKAHLVDLNTPHDNVAHTACGLWDKYAQPEWPPEDPCSHCSRVWDQYQRSLWAP